MDYGYLENAAKKLLACPNDLEAQKLRAALNELPPGLPAPDVATYPNLCVWLGQERGTCKVPRTEKQAEALRTLMRAASHDGTPSDFDRLESASEDEGVAELIASVLFVGLREHLPALEEQLIAQGSKPVTGDDDPVGITPTIAR